MTGTSNYINIVDRIFGTGSCALNAANKATNPIIGALSNATRFSTFRVNFIERLKRLRDVYDGHPSRNSILRQVNEIGLDRNWQGAAAELAAVDFFCSGQQWLIESPHLDVDIPVSQSLAKKFGMTMANLDVYFKHFDIYTDVKVLKDNVTQAIEQILQRVWTNGRPTVGVEYPYDVSADNVICQRKAILNHLRTELANRKKPEFVDCTSIVNDLIIRLKWQAGVLITESTYSPYRHAEELHRLPMKHAKKFVLSRPFFLTFVVFPWFNSVITDFCEQNSTLYRALARRTFCQYRNDCRVFSSLFEEYKGTETVHEVMRELGGILFLEDRCITSDSSNSTVKAFYFENPNAKRRPLSGPMYDYFIGCGVDKVDDFRHDNY